MSTSRFGVRVRAGALWDSFFWARICPESSPFLTGKELGDAVTYVYFGVRGPPLTPALYQSECDVDSQNRLYTTLVPVGELFGFENR